MARFGKMRLGSAKFDKISHDFPYGVRRIWRDLSKLRRFWQDLARCGEIHRGTSRFDGFSGRFGHLCHDVRKSDIAWEYWHRQGDIWHGLAHFFSSSPGCDTFDIIWHNLAIFGEIWKDLAALDRIWPDSVKFNDVRQKIDKICR